MLYYEETLNPSWGTKKEKCILGTGYARSLLLEVIVPSFLSPACLRDGVQMPFREKIVPLEVVNFMNQVLRSWQNCMLNARGPQQAPVHMSVSAKNQSLRDEAIQSLWK